jgi:16S rRNA (cytidine1402-2'-O)-methyltransferase
MTYTPEIPTKTIISSETDIICIMPGTLYIVATPIGNLEDITLRAIKVLTEVDVILAEDTRVTQKLLQIVNGKWLMINENKLKNNQPSTINHQLLTSYHQHSSEQKKLEILQMLMEGKSIALVTDAGTPGISDPGNELIAYLTTHIPNLTTIPIPGPSAITALLSVSGFDSSKFLFLGFWPKKKAKKLLDLIKLTQFNVVFYESPFRILKTLNLLANEFGNSTEVVVGRELTKMHETIYRGTIGEVIKRLSDKTIKGEIVVIIKR